MKNVSLLLLCLSVTLLTACEPRFAGTRAVNLEIINGPFQMRVHNVSGTQYLVVANTNYRFQAKTGSLHFYSLATPTAPVKNAALTVELPNNVSDFLIRGTALYVLDRSDDRLIIYDLVGGVFTQRLDANGDKFELKLTANPQSLLVFNRASDATPVMAILSQSQGTVQFLDLTTLALVTQGENENPAETIDRFNFDGIQGARFRMVPRQEEVAGSDDRVNISFREQVGFGMNGLVYLGTANDLIATAIFTDTGILSFRFNSFVNASNYAWDLRGFDRGMTIGGVKIPGSREDGFRSIVRDQAGNVYFTSRTDNTLYTLTTAQLSVDKAAGDRNTRGFPENEQRFALIAGFDTDITDEVFPRLGQMVTNCPIAVDDVAVADSSCPAVQAASVAWVLGLEGGKVFRVAPLDTSPAIASSADAAIEKAPQRILWHPTHNLLYMTHPEFDTITIMGADDLLVKGTLTNP